jgi:hypothetical protein
MGNVSAVLEVNTMLDETCIRVRTEELYAELESPRESVESEWYSLVADLEPPPSSGAPQMNLELAA